jgi:hypothetical protein
MAKAATLFPFTYQDADDTRASLIELAETLAGLRRALHSALKLGPNPAVIRRLRSDIDRFERYSRNGRQRLRQLTPKAAQPAEWRAAA